MDGNEIRVEKVRLSELRLDLSNLRGHGEAEIDLLVRSLTIFGQYRPLIVDKSTMTVKIGNGRLMAMRKMGWTECDCILLDWKDRDGMEVIDNRLNELSRWSDKSVDKWYAEKGKEWWGFDEEMASKVERIEKRSASSRSSDAPVEKPVGHDPVVHLCPCCGKPLKKKERMILD